MNGKIAVLLRSRYIKYSIVSTAKALPLKNRMKADYFHALISVEFESFQKQ